MASQAGDMGSVLSAVKWIGIVLGVAAAIAIACVVYFCCIRKDNGDANAELMDGLLRRDQLEETELEDEGKGWQCVVCGYANGLKRKTCLIGVGLVGDDSGTMGEDELATLRVRQRALFKRRMNTMAARKSLSQRQRGAFRRRLWQRKQLADGKFHWIRQNSTDTVNDSLAEFGTGENALSSFVTTSGDSSLAGPNGESLADYHNNFRSQGFVSMYDSTGRLTWKKADEVSIDMESFDKMRKGMDQIDFEVSNSVQLWSVTRTTHLACILHVVSLLQGVMALGFRMKKQWFLVQLSRIATPVTEAVAKLSTFFICMRVFADAVTRESIIEQSLQLAEAPPKALHAYLKITFEGEPGIDAGGLLREWFGIVCKQIFSEKMGLFVPTKGEDMSYWIDPLSGEKNESHLKLFRLAGILIGKALFEGLVLDVHLALPLLKHVLGIPISFSDLEFLDEELHRNCKWLRSNNHVENLALTFSVMLENGTEVDLKEDGRNIDVTDENKEEYLRLVLEHRMLDSISDQLQEFLVGIYDVVPKAMLSVFDYQELELILCGIPTIDTADWKTHTLVRYIKEEENKKGKITESQQNGVLEWFWIVIEGLAPEERARLLQFVTGTSRVPVEGFRGLMSSSGIIHQFTIQLVPRCKDKTDLFPKAHTCFNRLDLPMYRDMEELETYLTMVSQMEIFGFGLE
ncbi:hypothetical protein BBJ28_00008212 [Nothophytophthora sp. Chile5]|nr:hypothetical protein BBJ28_00008212 [Nothophytophthora sp. Chile5]